MAKLFPPTIDGKLPAAVYVSDNESRLRIPFQHNNTIGNNIYKGYWIKIKTASTNLQVALFSIDKSQVGNASEINCTLAEQLQIGQFYKLQLAYADENGEAGLYSTVGVFKCTTTQNVTASYRIDNILGLEVSGSYLPSNDDKTEVEYSYEFQIYNNTQLLYTSGELLHNSQDNDLGKDSYVFGELLPTGSYVLKYLVTTINQLFSTWELRFTVNESNRIMPQKLDIELINLDCGNVKVSSIDRIDTNSHLLRKNNNKWQHLAEIEDIDDFTFIDNTVEQGTNYTYALCKQTVNLSTQEYTIYKSAPVNILADYDTIQLSDASKQLSISLNPKITSYKDVIQEQKQDTIGGQYPFIFRNGNIHYKEIGFSGLISYHGDNDELFMKNIELGLDSISERTDTNSEETGIFRGRTTQLVGYNVAAERKFRNEVTKWLTNGQPKLFRSPTEGCYIVRLMNVALTPTEQLGRMIYSFSATAYEIAECNLNKLKEYDLIWGERNV